MGIDISYLLFLQNIRIATGGIFDEFFNALSKFAVDILPYLPFVVFWSVDKKWGYRFLTTLNCGEVLNGFLKLTVCAYRPWIRSAQIEPAGDSKVAATGYSFPSGHTMVATCNYGTVIAWQKDKRRWLAVLCAILLLLTGFSRNFLGVHTPQDVIVGFAHSVILILVIGAVQKKVDGDERKLDLITFAGAAVAVAVLVYIFVKPYPMDYVDGVLVVDPKVMMIDTIKACAGMLGFLAGSYIDRHYLKYEIPVGAAELPLLTCTGAAILFAWNQWFAPATMVPLLGMHWGNFARNAVLYFFGVVCWPMIIQKFCGSGKGSD